MIIGNLTKILITLAVVLLITGCGALKTRVDTKYVAIYPSDALLGDCEIPKPPSWAKYSSLDWDGREDLLIKDITRRINSASICNAQLKAIRSWKTKMMERDVTSGVSK